MVNEDVADAELEGFHANGVRAIRLDLFARADWPRAGLQAYITRMFERVQRRGWHLQFYAPGYVVRDLLPFLATIESDFVIDHMGYMLEEDGLGPADFAAFARRDERGPRLARSSRDRIASPRGRATARSRTSHVRSRRRDRIVRCGAPTGRTLPDGSPRYRGAR